MPLSDDRDFVGAGAGGLPARVARVGQRFGLSDCRRRRPFAAWLREATICFAKAELELRARDTSTCHPGPSRPGLSHPLAPAPTRRLSLSLSSICFSKSKRVLNRESLQL